jgi:hypothetical protein
MMKRLFAIYLLVSFGLAAPVFAQAPVTATCKDGTAFSGTTRSGACRGHGGVQTWGTSAAPAPPSPAPAATTTPPPSPSSTNAAAGGGAGQVWVNTASKVYHCPGDRYYGNTKKGTYMSEAAAKAQGDRPSNGKTCS